MRLHNTLSGRVEELEPLEPGTVRIYACGVTPYDQSHVGHAAQAIIFDVLVRYLRWRGNPAGGYAVTYVSNYTDVDDKVIERGRELDRDPLELAAEHIEQWEREQAALNLLKPDVRPRVTEEIETIVTLIERIIERDHAYATAEGNVYFRVRSMEDYGKLSHRDIDQLRSGSRDEPLTDKEDVLDFALWKATPAGEASASDTPARENGADEPKWPSPWGEGRPGWHIECSAMSQRYLGDSFDIHGGGIDLLFPHHENEIAQSEAAAEPGKPTFAWLWMHNGLVQHDGEKMSKSIGNVVTVEEALRRWSADAIRLFVLNGHYRSANNVTDEAMAAAEAGADRLRNALREDPQGEGPILDSSAQRERFIEAMEEDMGTPAALATLFDLARVINRASDGGRDVRPPQATLRELAEVLGLRLEGRSVTVEAATAKATAKAFAPTVHVGGSQPSPAGSLSAILFRAKELAEIAFRFGVERNDKDASGTAHALVERRSVARAEKDYETADAIREALAAIGLELEDVPGGTRIVSRG